ncbi:MAG: peptidylprolyl isomerase [Bacteroidaceae bacterium]|jgi:peptidyl-prolyl cis-trans isomerase SurA|nr:peptidylprolyl isomerase [Bacteroidaceae bacterium]
MKRIVLAIITIIYSLFLSPLFAQQVNNTIDEVIWVVGDEAILKSDVEGMRRDPMWSQIKGNPYCVIPERLAIQKLFLHQAVIDSIEVTDAQINSHVDNRINEMVLSAGSKEKLEEYISMPMSQIREELHDRYKDELTVEKMREKLTEDVKVSPAEVRRYFKDIPEDSLPLIPTQVEVEILVQHPNIPEEEINRVKEELRGFAERVTNGSMPFSTLAILNSEDQETKLQGGELPYMGKGELDPAFANVAFSLTDPKKVSKVVESEYGFHIIQLVDKRGDKIKVRHILRKPVVAQKDIDAALLRLDSIADDIRNEKFSFEDGATLISDDKDTRSNHGLMTNQKRNSDGTPMQTSKFEMRELANFSPELARVVDGLEIGEISKPFKMTDRQSKTVCAIAKLKSRIKTHRASISEDFQVLREIVLNKKKENLIDEWIRNKQKTTYIRIHEDWRDCDFEYPGWVK